MEKSTSCIVPLKTIHDEAIVTSDPAGISAKVDFLKKKNDITLKEK